MSGRLITLQYCSGFCHTWTWIGHGFTCIPHPDPPSQLPLHPIPLGLPSAPGLNTCLMHPAWAGDLFHPRTASKHVYYLGWNTPVFLPGESQGWGNLVGCHLWGRTEWDDWSDSAAASIVNQDIRNNCNYNLFWFWLQRCKPLIRIFFLVIVRTSYPWLLLSASGRTQGQNSDLF